MKLFFLDVNRTSGDSQKDIRIQTAKLGFWCGLTAVSLLTCAGFPILNKVGKISKNAMWIGVGSSGSVAALSAIFSLRARSGKSDIRWRVRVDNYLEDTSEYEQEVLAVTGPMQVLRSTAAIGRVEQRLHKVHDPRGLVWKITDSRGREHYLIGTCTLTGSQAMIEQEKVLEALGNTQTLISELGPDIIDGSFMKRTAAQVGTELFTLGVTRKARERGMTIRALETLDQRIARLRTLIATLTSARG